jgi:hypothetical protein
MQSSNSSLAFYFDILFINNIQYVKDLVIGNSTLQKSGLKILF